MNINLLIPSKQVCDAMEAALQAAGLWIKPIQNGRHAVVFIPDFLRENPATRAADGSEGI